MARCKQCGSPVYHVVDNDEDFTYECDQCEKTFIRKDVEFEHKYDVCGNQVVYYMGKPIEADSEDEARDFYRQDEEWGMLEQTDCGELIIQVSKER